MDFRRIEAIFLAVFIGLNVFLGFTFFNSQQVDIATTSAGNSAVVNDIKADGIKLPALPVKPPTGAYLASQGTATLNQGTDTLRNQAARLETVDGNSTRASTLATPLAVKSKTAEATLKKWVKDAGNVQHGNEYTYAKILSTPDRYVFIQRINGREVYDASAQLTLTVINGRLTGYTQTYISDMRVLRTDITLISAQDAVVALYRGNELPSNSTVLWTHLAYTALLDVKGSTVYIPAWIIGVESRSAKNVTIREVNAINKTVLKSRTDE